MGCFDAESLNIRLSWREGNGFPLPDNGWVAEPHQEQSGAFENESVYELGLRQPIEQALTAETSKRELMLDAELTAPFDEARLHRRDDVLGTVALHMTTVSR